MTLFDDIEFVGGTATLTDAREWLKDHADDGVKCPCCTQHVKVYRRKINSGMARVLIHQWCNAGHDFAHTATLCKHLGTSGREGAKLGYWNLMEHASEKRDDGGKSGFWRITNLGRQFVRNEVRISRYVYIYNGNVLGFDDSQRITITDALGDHFNYNELMDN
jgi:hypothetical protein